MARVIISFEWIYNFIDVIKEETTINRDDLILIIKNVIECMLNTADTSYWEYYEDLIHLLTTYINLEDYNEQSEEDFYVLVDTLESKLATVLFNDIYKKLEERGYRVRLVDWIDNDSVLLEI